MARDYVELAAVGDTRPGAEPPEVMFEYVEEALRSADVRFAQMEGSFSERGSQQQAGMPYGKLHPSTAAAYPSIPFEVLALASNHTGDWGQEAIADTVNTLRSLKVATVGVGVNLAEARKPAFVTRQGVRLAFLGYASVLLPGYWATDGWAGAAPMRAKTYYEPYEYQPGSPVRIVTVPDRGDLEQLQEDVRAAKREADCVIVSMHWGVHFVPKPLPDYQPMVAHAAIDAGANVILGTHPHLLQGIAAYRGALIFNSLGNFALRRVASNPGLCLPNCEYTFDQVYNREMEPGYTFRRHKFFPNAGIAYLQLDRGGVKRATFLPTVMNADRQPQIQRPGTPKFEEIREYLEWAATGLEGGINKIGVDGDRFVLFDRDESA